jgi:hypothetical protein
MEYIIEQFTSRNTSFDREIKKSNGKNVENYAKEISKNTRFPIIVRTSNCRYTEWSKFENGIKTEWSYPTGVDRSIV